MSNPQLLLLLASGQDQVALSTPINVQSTVLDPGTAVAQFQLQSDGDVEGTTVNNSLVDIGDWIDNEFNSGLYEVAATLVSGTLTSGDTSGAYFALSSNRVWTKSRSGIGSASASIDVSIRRIGTSTVLATARINLTATVDNPG